MKYILSLLACFAVVGCSTAQLQTLDSDTVAALSVIHDTTSTAIASGAIPSGQASSILNDVNTISSGLETVLTGQPLTTSQVSAVAASFKSNSATTAYATLATPIVNELVSVVNAKLNSGGTASDAQAAGVAVLVNAPAAVQSALATTTTAYCPVNPPRAPLVLRAPYGERDWQHVLLAKR